MAATVPTSRSSHQVRAGGRGGRRSVGPPGARARARVKPAAAGGSQDGARERHNAGVYACGSVIELSVVRSGSMVFDERCDRRAYRKLEKAGRDA